MVSIRAIAACVGVGIKFDETLGGSTTTPTPFLVRRHFLGCITPPPWKTAAAGNPTGTPLPKSLSLLKQIRRLQLHPHFNIDAIHVATDENGLLPPTEEENLACAVEIARDIYSKHGVAIGRVRHWFIRAEDAMGFDVVEDKCDADELVGTYSFGGSAADVFFVQQYDAGAGRAPAKAEGVVIELAETDFPFTGRTLAHELGHLIGGLGDNEILIEGPNGLPMPDRTNLMTQYKYANPMPGGTDLTDAQRAAVHEYDHMHSAC